MNRNRTASISLVALIICLVWGGSQVFGQEKKKGDAESAYGSNSNTKEELSYLPSVNVENQKKKENRFQLFTSAKKNKKNKGSMSWQLDQQVIQAEKRKKEVVKQNRKEARMSRKPQYSDHSYFGHKRKPKKRKPGKRKLCKECLIVH